MILHYDSEQYYSFYYIFYQIVAALVSKHILKILTNSKHLNGIDLLIKTLCTITDAYQLFYNS